MAVVGPPVPATTSWFSENWDKILTLVVAVIISGITGFFSAVLSIRGDMADLKERVAKIETQLSSTVNPKLSVVDDHTKSILLIQDQIKEMQQKTDLAVQTNLVLSTRLELARNDLIKELREFFEEVRGNGNMTRQPLSGSHRSAR
jgi:hypothetical protein